MSHSHGAVGSSAVCNCGIMWPYSLLALQMILFDVSLPVKAAPNECVIRTGQP